MTAVECQWCQRQDSCDCDERRTCDKAGEAGHRQCGALSCGCPSFIGICDEHGTRAAWVGGA